MNLLDFHSLIPDIFEKVKRDVENEIGRHRAGLTLGLVEMGIYKGNFIGGLFFAGGTMILMNITPLRIIIEDQSDEIIWSYIYHILLHEYLHSLGFLNERQCQIITLEISKNIFKDPKHPAIVLATKGIGAFFPNLHLIYAPPDFNNRKGLKIERIRDFDRESHQSYFV